MSDMTILDQAIRRIPDFPTPGILFYDITGVLIQPKAFKFCIEKMVELYKDAKIAFESAIYYYRAYQGLPRWVELLARGNFALFSMLFKIKKECLQKIKRCHPNMREGDPHKKTR